MGRLGQRRGAREGRAVPRLRRRLVHDRRGARRRRRHHRRLRHARVALSYDARMTRCRGCSPPRSCTRRSRTARSTPCSSRSPTCRAASSASASPATTGPSRCRAASEPVHVCNYLLAVDVDMNPLPGYQFANWEQGYGDVAVQPDLATIRRIPWLDADRARAVRRARRGDGRAGGGLAPPDPATPGRARRRARLHA